VAQDERIILKLILQKQFVRALTGLGWSRTGSNKVLIFAVLSLLVLLIGN
jgi:hypothetical protein